MKYSEDDTQPIPIVTNDHIKKSLLTESPFPQKSSQTGDNLKSQSRRASTATVLSSVVAFCIFTGVAVGSVVSIQQKGNEVSQATQSLHTHQPSLTSEKHSISSNTKPSLEYTQGSRITQGNVEGYVEAATAANGSVYQYIVPTYTNATSYFPSSTLPSTYIVTTTVLSSSSTFLPPSSYSPPSQSVTSQHNTTTSEVTSSQLTSIETATVQTSVSPTQDQEITTSHPTTQATSEMTDDTASDTDHNLGSQFEDTETAIAPVIETSGQ